MPTYEYACSACGNLWEEVQRISASALDTCPKCGQKTAQRQISGGGAFILKGGGWYSDLYSSSKKPSGTDAKSTASTTTASSEGSASKESSSSTESSSSKPSGDKPSGDGGGSSSKPAAAELINRL